MTLGEMEIALKKVADNQIVQGELLNRTDQLIARNAEAIARLAGRHAGHAIGHAAIVR